jgi:hypothetical protein
MPVNERLCPEPSSLKFKTKQQVVRNERGNRVAFLQYGAGL